MRYLPTFETKPAGRQIQCHATAVMVPLLIMLLSHPVSGWCPPKDRDKLQDRFFKCVRTMDAADQDGDDQLDFIEFENYVHYLALTLYVVPLFKKGDGSSMPQEFDTLFGILVQASGGVVNENGTPQIDIFGSNIKDMPLVDERRFNALHEICDQTVQAFEDTFPGLAPDILAPPKMLVLASVVAENELADKDDFEWDAQVLSIHSSFIIANFEGIEATGVDISPGSSIHEAYVIFLDELMQTVCPADGTEYTECWEDPDASYEEAYESESGRLCGSHAEYIRRIFCDARRRRNERDLELETQEVLEPDHIIENIVLYKVQDSNCPIPMISQGKGGGYHPMCQTIFAHYLLHLHDLEVGDKAKLEEVYVNITQSAIHNGMLEDSLDALDPDSEYIVEAAGPLISPTVHTHSPFHDRRLTCRQRLLRGSLLAKHVDEHQLAILYQEWIDRQEKASFGHDITGSR